MLPFVRKLPGAPRIGDLAARPIPIVAVHISMGAARKIAALKRMSLLLVERQGLLVGTIDERALATAADDTGVAAAMRPLGPCLHPAMTVGRAHALFLETRAPILPIVAGGFVIGAIARGDIEAARAPVPAASKPRAQTSFAA